MLRIVLDTNVYISAILFGGKPEKIRSLSRDGEIEFLVSEAIILEIADVLRRKFNWESWQISLVIDEVRESATLIIPRQSVSVIQEDEADNRVLECALEGNAEYIISGDKRHLLQMARYGEIEILSPDEFLRLL